MKIAKKIRVQETTAGAIVPAIPFEREPVKAPVKGEYHTYKLRTQPTDSSSPVYDLSVPVFDHGTPEVWLRFVKNLKSVFTGQNITSGPTQYALARCLLKGDALAVFEAAATAHGTETLVNFKKCLQDLTAHVFPEQALQVQKRYMRRYVKKPLSMRAKEFVARVVELNDYMLEFPIPTTTPVATKLNNDELMDVLEFALPAPWRKEMARQNFIALTNTPKGLVEFCQRIERFEVYDSPNKKRPRESSHEKKVLFASRTKPTASFYCALHGDNPNHDTDDCNAIKSLKRRKPDRDKYEYKKKSSYSSKKDLNAFITAKVNEALMNKKKDKKNELNTFEQFRDVTLSDSDDDKVAADGQSHDDHVERNPFSESEQESDDDSN